MPASWVSKSKDGEKAWKKAKGIVDAQYPDVDKETDSEKYYSLVTQIMKSICKSEKYDCGDFPKSESMSELLRRLEETAR